MKIGDLVKDEFNEDVAIVVTQPRLSGDCVGVTVGDVYDVVEVLCPDGCVRQFATDELRVISESRNAS